MYPLDTGGIVYPLDTGGIVYPLDTGGIVYPGSSFLMVILVKTIRCCSICMFCPLLIHLLPTADTSVAHC